jgi:Cu2+-exporting ATPase
MTTGCFHCGTRLQGDARHELLIDGERAGFCSDACYEIARRIQDEKLTRFYRFREAPSAPATDSGGELARWAGYDRPALQREFVTVQPDGSHEAQLLVHGVRCAACAWLIERAMAPMQGVREISVDPLTTRMRLRWDDDIVRLSEILARIAALGYEPFPSGDTAREQALNAERRRALRRLIVAGLGMSATMSYAIAIYAGAFRDADPAFGQFFRLVSLLVATPVVFYSGVPFFRGAWRGLRSWQPGMDVPVALAIAAAYAASAWNTLQGAGEIYFDSAVMFVFFLSGARFLEMAGRHRALGLTAALARHLPHVANRLTGGRIETVGVMELQAGDHVLVPPGQAIPVDGILASGSARIDESLLTGESRPVHKAAGDTVVAGSTNLMEAMTIRVERVGSDTVLAGISRLIDVARTGRPRLVEVTDRVARWFVTGVLILASAVGAAWWFIDPARAFEVVLAVLVVTCPCALALATPAAFSVGTHALARRGILLRRAGALETLSKATDFVFDKTGTLTEHSGGVTGVETFGTIGRDEALALAGALESRSEHPLARAFPQPTDSRDVVDARAVPGQGVEGRVAGRPLRIGRRQFALGLGHPVPGQDLVQADPATSGQSVYLGDESGLLARFDVAERVRPDAIEAVTGLREAGIRVTIASGDEPGAVQEAARRLGIADWHSALQPADKLTLARNLQSQGRIVGMVGDGINDSPVLAGADVSVAIGSGTSLAQHSADCVLVGNRLGALPAAVVLARRTMRIVRQNLAWAIGYNALTVPFAAAGMLPPWLAALGMSMSSLLVTFNALRLGWAPEPAPPRQPAPELAPRSSTP